MDAVGDEDDDDVGGASCLWLPPPSAPPEVLWKALLTPGLQAIAHEMGKTYVDFPITSEVLALIKTNQYAELERQFRVWITEKGSSL